MNQDKPIINHYPQSFHPKALWCCEEICAYLHIGQRFYYDIEAEIPTFKTGQRRVAYAEDVIAWAERRRQEQNPLLARRIASV